ncbi:MAG: hypothetical protein ACRD0N_04500 [Acidimicrobiales bacterium]
MRDRRAVAAVVAVAGTILVGISTAWACTGQPLMHLASDAVGEARSEAKVEVLANQAVSGPVVLRWNSLEGPVLARADVAAGEAATLDATIPDAEPGVYYLVLQTNAGIARSAFQVSGAGAGAPSTPWPAAEPAGTGGPFSSLEAGMGLLGAGLVGMAGLTLVGVARRRRAAATA